MSVSSVGGGVNMAALMSKVSNGQQAQGGEVAQVVKDQMRQEGQQTLQLIQSAGQSPSSGSGSVGKTVDVMV